MLCPYASRRSPDTSPDGLRRASEGCRRTRRADYGGLRRERLRPGGPAAASADPASSAATPFRARPRSRRGGAEPAGDETRWPHGRRRRPGGRRTCARSPARLRARRRLRVRNAGRWWRRTGQYARVGQQRGAGGADFAEGPHLADRRVVPQDEDDGARAGDPGVLVQRAPLASAPAGGVVMHRRRSGVRGRVGHREAAQGREVPGARRHHARRGAGDGRGAVPVPDHADRPAPARTAGRWGVRVHKSQSTCPSWGRAMSEWGSGPGVVPHGPAEVTSLTACPEPPRTIRAVPFRPTHRLSVRTPKLPP